MVLCISRLFWGDIYLRARRLLSVCENWMIAMLKSVLKSLAPRSFPSHLLFLTVSQKVSDLEKPVGILFLLRCLTHTWLTLMCELCAELGSQDKLWYQVHTLSYSMLPHERAHPAVYLSPSQAVFFSVSFILSSSSHFLSLSLGRMAEKEWAVRCMFNLWSGPAVPSKACHLLALCVCMCCVCTQR